MTAKRCVLLAVVGVLACCVAAVVIIYYGLLAARGVPARQEPSVIEAWVANHLLDLLIPRKEKDRKNPLPATTENASAGQQYFVQKCAFCHGYTGDGKTEIGAGLYPHPPDLSSEDVQKLPDGELFYIIQNGIRNTGMPGWAMPDEQAWQLAIFVRSLAKGPSR
jgi:mono/diheme cytochrome c family protein